MDNLEGSGTEQDPYKIECFEQLQDACQELDACYRLISNIDATDRTFEPIGGDKKPFRGTFDGNNYEIHNLCIKQPDEDNIGLFGWIGEEGQVRNLSLTNATIRGSRYVGGLVGYNCGEVESCYKIEGDISGDRAVGGLVASNYGKVESSYVQGGDVSGDEDVGGLVGKNFGEEMGSDLLIRTDPRLIRSDY